MIFLNLHLLNKWIKTKLKCVKKIYKSEIWRDKTIDDKLMYTPNHDTKNKKFATAVHKQDLNKICESFLANE